MNLECKDMKKESQHPPKTAVKPKPPPAPPKGKTPRRKERPRMTKEKAIKVIKDI
jgi:hypothetical protein